MERETTPDPFERVSRVVHGGAGAGEAAGTRAVAHEPSGGGRWRWRGGGLPLTLVGVGVLVAAVVVLGGSPGRDGGDSYVVGAGTDETSIEVTAPGTTGSASTGPAGGAPGTGAGTGPAPATVPPTAAAPDPAAAAPDPAAAAPDPAAAVPDPAAAAPSAAPGSGTVVVHVDGAVHRPGVVRLVAGDRVADAVDAAGGVLPEADTRLVNLARHVVDGELVVVPVEGETPPAAEVPAAPPGPAAAASTGPGTDLPPEAAAGLVPLNSASAQQLQALPGIGPVLAERVVAWREEVGPFTSVDELTAVSGIGPAVLERVRDLVTL